MQERNIDFYSNVLGKNLRVQIIGHWGYPVLMFPTSMGSVSQNKDMGLINSVRDLIDGGIIKTYNIETIDFDSFYGNGLSPHDKAHNYELYTRFLTTELVPKIQEENNVHRVGLAGCSFGAYHAMNFAFKQPDLTRFVIGMSGSYDISSFMHGYHDDNVYFNNPVEYVPNEEAWKYNHMKIVLGTSNWDICLGETKRFSSILTQRGIDHWYDEKKWAEHDWPLWNTVFSEYLNSSLQS